MCGITGFIDFWHSSSIEVLGNMVRTLHHRGPDDHGTELFDCGNARIGLGHARLSIIDLSPAGHQPMSRGHLAIVFNGEIYNYKEIQQELIKKGYEFSSDSDTEVILHAFAEWGVHCVNRFIGMFAFVLINKKEAKAYFFRDRAGVKPLFIYQNKDLFLFASELKAFHVHPDFEKEIDREVLPDYFDLGYIPGNQCIFKNVQKLTPGSYLTLDLASQKVNKMVYWDAAEFYARPKFALTYAEAREQLHELLQSAFQYRMVADVPVGVFLSGGYDSTAVAAILQQNSNQQLKTFTIGFEHGNNEAPYAHETAKYLGTDHYEYTCTTKEAQDIIPELPYYFDEPFGDSSAIPTVLVSQFAKKHVTVALSADGGDELFSGYNRYAELQRYEQMLKKIPVGLAPLMKLGGNLAGAFLGAPRSYQLTTAASALKIKDRLIRRSFLYDKMHRMPQSIHTGLLRNNEYPHMGFGNSWNFNDKKNFPLLHDFKRYLPDDILTKVDRATMSVSLEGREPLLDHRILEFAAGLPYEYKRRGNCGKRILKEITHQYLPKSMLDRPKTGFRVPLTQWLRNDLNKELQHDLQRSNVNLYGVLNPAGVEEVYNNFRNRNLHYIPLLWRIWMLQKWLKVWM